jgi:hypothetical protein
MRIGTVRDVRDKIFLIKIIWLKIKIKENKLREKNNHKIKLENLAKSQAKV